MTGQDLRPRSLAGRGRPLRAVPENATAGDITGLWAEQQHTALGVAEAPEYGSPAWVQLRAEDPRRAAAIIEAAELWRRRRAHELWLDRLLDEDPDRWYSIVTEEANAAARAIAPALARRLTADELRARRAQIKPVHVVRASPGWPPVAIPGRPGWYRHLINDGQVDLQRSATPGQENRA
ncbi:hypothetical protein [Streptomyces sp. NPDC053079]|uniref:hypothetical protein n=1 Tax=Streptomyces sp. NPDC053079 TaxID=3365697 RepID=UPI0037D84497